MDYQVLGQTGVEVSRICLGTMSFGGDADVETSASIYHRCREAGVNFFDCANVYPGKNSAGKSEEILGALIQNDREQIILASKVFATVGPDRNDGRLSRRHVTRAVEDSLRRLRTDRLDVYYMHQFDNRVPIEECLRAFEDLVRSGKILYPAVSNWAAWQTAIAICTAEWKDWSRIEATQPMYSLAKRQAEVEILPLARARNMGVVAYSPVGAGLLAGKYGRNTRPSKGRLVENDMYTKRYGDEFYFELAEDFTHHCGARGVHPVTVAVGWVLSNDAVTSAIIGARNVDQLEPSLAAIDLHMDDEWYAEVSALSPAPPPATDRLETVR